MKTPIKFKEYIWLVNTIRKARRITLAEINEKWLETAMSEGIPLARSTFNRHKDAIEDMFGIFIDCDRQHGFKYFIANPEVLQEDSVQTWMLSTLSVNNVVSESLSLQHRILLEQAPVEGGYLQILIDAMKKNVRIEAMYRKYGDEEPRHLTFAPYCIKLCKQRWYVLGHFHHDASRNSEEYDYFGIFSLDRIVEMRLTTEKFLMDPTFDAKDYFKECFGVVANEATPAVKIVLRAFEQEVYYLRDLPIHESQKEIATGEEFADFEFFIRPTLDFVGYLMGRGAFVKVLEPAWLATEVKMCHLEAAGIYD